MPLECDTKWSGWRDNCQICSSLSILVLPLSENSQAANVKVFQGPNVLFTNFQGLEFWCWNSRTFKVRANPDFSEGWKKIQVRAYKTGSWFLMWVLLKISDVQRRPFYMDPQASVFVRVFFIPWGSRVVVTCLASAQSDVCPTVEPSQYTVSPSLVDYQADWLRTGILRSKASSQMS